MGTHNNYNPPENCKILCVFQRKITRSDVFFVWVGLQDFFMYISCTLTAYNPCRPTGPEDPEDPEEARQARDCHRD